MAAPESDEEYDKRRRDKFRRERNDVRTKEDWEDSRSEQYNRNVRSNPNNAYNNNNKTRGENYRNISASGGDFEAGGATKRRRYEEYSPPTHYNNNNKKGRRPPTDWDESSTAVGGGAYYGPPGAYWGPPPPLGAEYPPPGHLAGHPLPPGAMSYRAGYSHDDNHLMSFKQYLLEQEDTIEPEEAVRRYKNYTLEFQRHAISLFFNAHKGEEWFKNKYHPDEREKFKQEKEDKVKLRLAIFMDFYESGLVDKIVLNQYHIPDIVKFMDSVIVRLEGGTDADVKALDSESYGVSSLGGGNQLSSEGVAMAIGTNQKEANNEKKAVSSRKSKEKKPNTSINDENNNGGIADEKMEAKNDENGTRPDILDNDDMEDIGDLEDSFSGHVTSEAGTITMATSGGQQNGDMPDSCKNAAANNNGPDDEEKLDFEIEEHEMHDNKEKDKPPTKRHGSSRSSSCSSFHSSSSSSDSTSSKRSHGSSRHHNNKQTDSDMVLLHKTTSIFLRNLPPAITKAEIENLCKDYKGYLRVALADPLPERKFYRRGWVTFDSRANVKEICATLGTMKVRECEMGPIVNRDITRRVRLINGLVIHHAILLRDICLSLHVMHVLDRKYNLWTTPFNEENESTKKSSDDVVDSNGGIILQSADAEPATEPEKDKEQILTTVSNNSNNVAPLSVQARYRKELTQAQNTEKLIKNDLEKDQKLLSTLLLFDENQPQEEIENNTRDEEGIIDKLCRELNITNPIIKALITKLKQYQDHRINQKNEIRAVSPTSDVEEGEMVGDKPGSSLGENHTYKDLSTITDNVNDETTGDKKFDRLNNDETIINGNLSNVDPRTLGTLISIEKDDALAKVLDVLILYLRVVHSLDYYSVSEYPNEDDMPNKCGIMHCRGALTQNRVLNREIYDWMKSFEKKIANFISLHNAQITLEDARVLGLRDYDTEVEKFIKDNIQELSKDKWLCPLSGKKFKGPDFVRKHIINKHAEKLENVKVEVDYFNNYLLDPRRPHVQDGNAPSSGGVTPAVLPSAVTGGPNAPSAVTSGAQGKGGTRSAVFANGVVSGPHHPPPPYYGSGPYSAGDMGGVGKGTADMYHTPPVYGSGAGVRGFGHSGYERNMYMKRKGFGSQREIVTYRDLDAPEEPEQFF